MGKNRRQNKMGATTSPEKKAHDPRFVVGVDFGTTFTSVAFAHSASPEDVKLVQTWPNGSIGNSSADQVPSVVYYTNPRTRANCWGYEVPPPVAQGGTPHEALRWFKLLLQENPTSRRRNPSARQSSLSTFWQPDTAGSSGNPIFALQNLAIDSGSCDAGSLGPSFTAPTITPALKTAQTLTALSIAPVAVVQDFLAAVRNIAIDSIKRTYESQWVADSKLSYVLTVPAIWSDSAKSLMIQAAQRAGYGTHRVDFDLISEPEAAAAYTLKAIQPNHLRVGDTFIILDAGGGTVDLISYKITGLNPLQLIESVSGSGDQCGSVFLDERFEKYIRGVLGNKVFDAMKPRSKAEMMRTWEEKVKFKFGLSSTLEVVVPGIPDNAEKRIEDCFHTMTTEDVKRIFDPVVDRIEELVKEQVGSVQRKGERVAAILLVGGFGSSEYLRNRLQDVQFGSQGTIEVLQPMNARTAIARGALLRGLDGSIVRERRSRRFYGCISNANYETGKGLEDHMFWNEAADTWWVRDKLNWYVKRDEVIGDTVSVAFPLQRNVAVPTTPHIRPSMIFTDTLYACDMADAPDYRWKNQIAVHRICSLHSDLSGISLAKFPKVERSNGKEYYKILFELKMTVLNEVIKFEMIYDGVSQGEVTTRFEGQ